MEDTTMKKTYIIPEMEIVKLKAYNQLLAGSSQGVSNETPSEWAAPGMDDDMDW